jgi:hypothetical protein
VPIAVGQPQSFSISGETDFWSGEVATDGDGNLVAKGQSSCCEGDRLFFYNRDGKRAGATPVPDRASRILEVVPQKTGAQVVYFGCPPGGGDWQVRAYDALGKETKSVSLFNGIHCGDIHFGAASDPRDGLAVAFNRPVESGGTVSRDELFFQLFDAAGGARFGPQRVAEWPALGQFVWTAIGTDASGATLVLYNDEGALMGRWFDAAGAPNGQPLKVGDYKQPAQGEPAPFLSPLLGGGLALSVAGQWKAVLKPGSVPEQAPSWLAARPKTRLQWVRNRRAYALLPLSSPQASSADANCSQSMELLAEDGALCSQLTFAGGTGCMAQPLRVGVDGTVILPPRFAYDSASNSSVTQVYFWRSFFP